MNAHVPVIATGATHNLNNPSVIKTSPSHWLMVYTQENAQDSGMVNKPGISVSRDGVRFSPDAGGQNYLNIKDYPYNWTRADVNGGNVLLQVNDTLHFYFVDFKASQPTRVYHATAPATTGSPPSVFTYQSAVIPEKGLIVNDVKA